MSTGDGDKGSCTWTFNNGVWTVVDNCKPGATCIGPIPLGPNDAPLLSQDDEGNLMAPDTVVQHWREHSTVLHEHIPNVAENGAVIVIPCA
mgnify:CR=1 FL=1